jgi:F-type H+-transporting ATPase subunit delta
LKAIAERYASALADVALEQKKSEPVASQLAAFVELFESSTELRTFLASPAVAREHKHAVIEKLATRLGAEVALKNFLFVLVDNRRTGELAHIARAFTAVLQRRMGVTEARVLSARALGEREKSELIQALERLTGQRIVAKYGEDPELIAGAVVSIGSTVYDGSVRAQLDRLRARLASE